MDDMKGQQIQKWRQSGAGIAWVVGGLLAVCLLPVCLLPAAGYAQVSPGSEEAKVDAAWKAEVIDSVLETLDKNYVFPDVAEKMSKHIRKQQKNKAYKDLDDAFEFSQKLTEDLREICQDKHLGVRFMPGMTEADVMPDSLMSDEMKKQQEEEYLQELKFKNFGFHKLERLEGNIGYLDLRGFIGAEYGGPTAVAAMNFLANSEAVIIDLRQNGGGHPSMIQLMSSYFFDEPTHLNNFYYRPADSIQQFWTQAHVQGQRMTDVDLYVLTSGRTFSGAEEFTYNMKNLERATIIGETTGGGAHPVDGFGFFNLKTSMSVPIGRAVNPITGTNWEGTGIAPHIDVPQEDALERAHLEALKKIHDQAPEGDLKDKYRWAIDTKETLANPVTVSMELMKKYAGLYGPRTVTVENGELYYQREDRPKYKMIPMSDDTFIFAEIEYFRLKFVSDEDGSITEVVGLYDDGYTDRSPRNPGQ
jgi:C-terminal processing protease CtpA/Prc